MHKIIVSGVAGIVYLTDTFETEIKVTKEGLWLRPMTGEQSKTWRFSPWDEVWFGSRKMDEGVVP